MTVARRPVLILAAVLAVSACGGAENDAGAAPPDGSNVAAAGEAPAAVPAPGAPMTAEDSVRAAREDSLYEARLLRTRQAAMDSYAGCMEKTKDADPPQRAILEAACQRSRGASAGTSPP